MKKVLFAIIMLMAFSANFASVQQVCGIISLQVAFDDPTNNENPFPKTPILIPTVSLDDHEITFSGIHPAFTLLILEDDVVFTVDVPSTASSVILPQWLTGEYEIVLRPSGCSYYFYGYIEL